VNRRTDLGEFCSGHKTVVFFAGVFLASAVGYLLAGAEPLSQRIGLVIGAIIGSVACIGPSVFLYRRAVAVGASAEAPGCMQITGLRWAVRFAWATYIGLFVFFWGDIFFEGKVAQALLRVGVLSGPITAIYASALYYLGLLDHQSSLPNPIGDNGR